MRRLLPFALVLAAFAAAWVLVPKKRFTARPDKNLVLVIACTLRADQTSLGGPLDTTPYLASLGAEGAVFTDLIAAAPWTRAASTALITGRSPGAAGLSDPGPGANDRALPAEVTTLAEALHDQGWVTLGATANPNLSEAFQFDQGFDVYESLSDLWRHGGRAKVPGTEVNATAARLLDAADPSRPTYLQLMYVDSHAPLDAEEAEWLRFVQGGVPRHVAEYRGLLTRLDARLAELDALLAERGLTPENTVLAVVGDHGEGLLFPRHHGMGHGLYLYPSTLHVPFVVRGPGIAPGTRIEDIAAGVDVAPTLAELVGVPFEGTSHAAALRGEAPPAREVAYASTWFRNAHRGAAYRSDVACLEDFRPDEPAHPGADKPPFPEACFDRRFPEFAEPTERDAALAEALRAWFVEEERALTAVDVELGEVEDDLSQALRALGYATDDE
ncbi:MAG: hypothetical protein EP330_17615 [Deltaproteobacteria bacterium]|nr:MAG: hypothetical protein EP330_17615 [Deltaproteobacteria bacterium]